MSASAQAPARIKLFWKPGCSSCLRTKEFLIKQGIDFVSVNAIAEPDALEELKALGARGLPVITLGNRFTLCQSFGDVLKFLDLKVRLGDPLPPEQLFAKLRTILDVAARITRQFPPAQLKETFRERPRTKGALAFHIFRVVEMGIDAAEGKGMNVEGFSDVPPDDWTGEDIVAWGTRIRDRALAWWDAQTDRALKYKVSTYYGDRELHDVLERMVWHAAQHTRQLALMLEDGGTKADRPLTAEDLKGLPVPDEVWG
ncbi:MAG TPA: DinB family protein [Ramlibacter sp.]|uniref:glutaredoxin domain-containing protein n=1 Tax=Ramlibacter sp. TaxID=1917967 RepID=UPI002B75837A|nr:DinB family protein [Ramlibacter sp.]HVZ43598.1 DinB family protein [Ramlibacter sp.]